MGVLQNPRHERFAQEIVKGLCGSEAYKTAGFASTGNAAEACASRLLRDAKVAARIDELKQRAAADVQVSREWVLEQLIENASKAKLAGDFGPSNQALSLIGKELGMFVERSENVNINHDVSDKPVTEDEWAQQHSRPN